MKRILIKLFFQEKFVGQVSTFVASSVAALIISVLPKVPELVTSLLGGAMGIPDGETITKGGLVAALIPAIAWAINAIVQQFVAKDNNALLVELRQEGKYDGPLDGWVGPRATQGVLDVIAESKTY
jgi:hypothetical protein